MRRTLAAVLTLASSAMACRTPEPQIIWPEPLDHPSPSASHAPAPARDPELDRRQELLRTMHVCHPWTAAVMRFEPGEVWPESHEPELEVLRERVASWCELDDMEQPIGFLAQGLHHPDEEPTVAVGRAEAIERFAMDAGIDPSMLVSGIRVAEGHELDHAHVAVLLAVSEMGCLL